MNQFTTLTPSLFDVLAIIRYYKKLSSKRREAMISALRSLESWTGTSLKDIPGNVQQLGELFETIQPAALGIAPKTLANVKSLCLAALSTSELVPGVVRTSAKGRPKNAAWADLWNALTTQAPRNNVSRLVNWCNRNSIAPEAVNDDVIDRVMAEMAVSSLRSNQYQVRRNITKVWNGIVEIFPDKGLQKVAIPPSRLRRTRVPLDSFPPSLLADWQNFATWAHGEDVFADDARPKPLKLSTLDTMLRHSHLAASTLVETGVDPAEIRTLADLVSPGAFRSILRHRLEAAGGKASYNDTYMAVTLLQLARDWVKVDDVTWAELKRLKSRLPQVSFGMTRKNKLLVMKFDESALKERLLSAPDRMWQHVQGSTKNGRLRLAEAQAALGINILMYHPIRLGNLTALTFDQHLFIRAGGTSTLVLSAEETKTGAAVEFDIPPPLAARLTEYRDAIAPAIMGKQPKYLFSNADASVKDLASVRYLIQRYLKHFVGVHMPPHVFRHLAAKFILDANPGAHVVVQQLGHKKLATTANFYAGFDTRRAGRHHQTLLELAMAERGASRTQSKTIRRAA